MMKFRIILASLVLMFGGIGCAFLPQNGDYAGPVPRSPELKSYYHLEHSFASFRDEIVSTDDGIVQHEITIETPYGPAEVDYFDSGVKSDNVVLVFPILGGNYLFERHFAKYFAERGLDAGIVRRNSEFKDPNRLFEVEELLRAGILRDRIVLDFFEKQLGKKNFGSFGISRGGINVALLAGIDSRMKYNVIVMGGTDLPAIFQYSDQPGIDKYRQRVRQRKDITHEQMVEILRAQIKTDPRKVAKHIDSRNTMMILAALDDTVPFKYGLRLRRHIGEPDTVVMLANHYTSLLFTQFIHVLLPSRRVCLFPFDYVESEAMGFYRKSFGLHGGGVQDLVLAAAKAPFEMVNAVQCAAQSECRTKHDSRSVRYRRVQSQQFARRVQDRSDDASIVADARQAPLPSEFGEIGQAK